ncbi:MAG: DUF4831 family protein [Rikenellaceae bacterium]
MKKLTAILALSLLTTASYSSFAQSKFAEQVSSYIIPMTAIKVSITVESESVKVGPYARFAQQYLGVTAPLNDRTTHQIVATSMDSYDEADLSNIYVLNDTKFVKSEAVTGSQPQKSGVVESNDSSISSEQLFTDLGLNPIVYKSTSSLAGRMSSTEKSLEEMASEAATTIFTLRRRRFDLITGEMGENVFGAGMEAALKEIARIEDEYLSLFLGKSSKSYKTYSYDVTPEKEKSSYILARFSQLGGIVEPSDLTGDPLVLTVTAEGVVKPQQLSADAAKKKTEASVTYRVADMASCKLFLAEQLLDNERIAVLQYGITVEK